MRKLLAHNCRTWRRAAAAGTFAAILSGTMLAVGVPAASAETDAPQAPAITQGKVVNHACQTRTGGVQTCEWLYETKVRTLNGTYTLSVVAYASMNGSENKYIMQVQTWARRFPTTSPHE